jgi:hypothetical protein
MSATPKPAPSPMNKSSNDDTKKIGKTQDLLQKKVSANEDNMQLSAVIPHGEQDPQFNSTPDPVQIPEMDENPVPKSSNADNSKSPDIGRRASHMSQKSKKNTDPKPKPSGDANNKVPAESLQTIRTSSDGKAKNTKRKSKRVELDYSVFKYKSAFLTLQSSAPGKVFASKDIKPVFMELPDSEKEIYKAIYQEATDLNESSSKFTMRRFKEFIAPYYTIFREMTTSYEINKPKKNILIRLKEMFDNDAHDSSVFYYNGPATKSGGLIIESKDKGEEEMFFKEVAAEWKARTSNQKHLLVILECNYAGKWLKELSELKIPDVSILAACKEKEKVFTTKIGGVFMHNFLKYLRKIQPENLVPVESSPIFGGDYMRCKQYTNFYLPFKDWSSLTAIQKSEFAEIIYENGRYIGYQQAASKHYWGRFLWVNGMFKDCEYHGEFEKGQLHGKGIMIYKNGRVYAGDFVTNAPDGNGEEVYPNNDKYVGKYRKGFKSGNGVYTYSNGDVYKGAFAENKPHGKGVLMLKNGSEYVGEFKNGKCNGKGTFKYRNGDVYEGEWNNSLKHGKGKYMYNNGDVYEGDFINGVRHGKGTFVSKQGETYKGSWALDLKSGEGEIITADSKTTGEWILGKIAKQPTFFAKNGTKQIEAKLA